MKEFLVTGGNGYIGSHMCKLLHSMGHKVIVLDNHSTSPTEQVHNYGEFYRGDVGDPQIVNKILKAHSIRAVFHFAAFSVVGESEQNPFLYFSNNTDQTSKFLRTLIENDIKDIVFSSTSSTYGTNNEVELISEDTPVNPGNAYALSKKMVEDQLFYLSPKYKLNVAILRYFNVAGSAPDLTIGENHTPESHLIPSLVLSFLNQKEIKFQLFGVNHPTPDGTCIRDYIHVDDLVKAHYAAFENFSKNPGLQVFNLGSGRGYSVKEVMSEFEKITGKKLDFEVAPARVGDPPRLVCQISKAKKYLNFQNQYTLKDCLEHSFNYLKKKHSLRLQTQK